MFIKKRKNIDIKPRQCERGLLRKSNSNRKNVLKIEQTKPLQKIYKQNNNNNKPAINTSITSSLFM